MELAALLSTLRCWRRVGRWWPSSSVFETAVGAVLVQRSRWENVEAAIGNLRRDGLLSPEGIAGASDEELWRALRPSGTYRAKAATLRRLNAFLHTRSAQGVWKPRFSPSRPPRRDQLLKVKGIGEETADAILLYCFDAPRFVVDASALRLFGRLPIRHGGPAHLRESAVAQLPDASDLMELHGLIVDLGKAHCRTRPSCPGCPLERDCERKGVIGERKSGRGRAKPPRPCPVSNRPGRPSRRNSGRRG